MRIGEEWQRCETNADCPSSHSCQGSHKVCCPTAQSLCTQPKRLGDCTSAVRRYWYNAATRSCEMFQYTGCQGNDNNFNTLMACQQKCRGIHGKAWYPLKNLRILNFQSNQNVNTVGPSEIAMETSNNAPTNKMVQSAQSTTSAHLMEPPTDVAPQKPSHAP